MSEELNKTRVTILPESQQLNQMNWIKWKNRIQIILLSQGLISHFDSVGGAHGMRAEGGTSRVRRAAARAERGNGHGQTGRAEGRATWTSLRTTKRTYPEELRRRRHTKRNRKLSSRRTRAEGWGSQAKGSIAIAEDNALQYLLRRTTTTTEYRPSRRKS